MIEHQYAVAGMTCQNCRHHVTDALSGIERSLADEEVALRLAAPAIP
jgi:copper chaperone CopZ